MARKYNTTLRRLVQKNPQAARKLIKQAYEDAGFSLVRAAEGLNITYYSLRQYVDELDSWDAANGKFKS